MPKNSIEKKSHVVVKEIPPKDSIDNFWNQRWGEEKA